MNLRTKPQNYFTYLSKSVGIIQAKIHTLLLLIAIFLSMSSTPRLTAKFLYSYISQHIHSKSIIFVKIFYLANKQ